MQSADEMDISAARGVAVREFPLKTGVADYLLYGDCKALGTVEAKPEGHTLTGVESQSAKYSKGLPAGLPHFHLPLPFAYESTGSVTQFTNLLDPHARSREIFTFHRPEELIRLATLESQLRANLRNMPELITTGLWNVQAEAIHNLELSLAANYPRAVIQMATGSGKTFTGVTSSYRLIKFGKVKRILFLVDRNSPAGNARVMESAASTSGLYTLSVSKVSSLPVPIASVCEQEQIVAEVDCYLSIIDESESQITTNLKRSARLRLSILKRAFEGKLVPQDPNDEPASVLLDRIKVNNAHVTANRFNNKAQGRAAHPGSAAREKVPVPQRGTTKPRSG
ncbi:MAG: DEAD/DEAH box helicase family protein [Planctomycetota bacterium]